MDTDRPSTRGKILRSAHALIYREGFSRVSMDAIAEGAGVTKRTVYYHFDSKDSLVAAVLVDQHRYMLQEFRSWAGPAPESAAALVENLFSALKAWADGAGWMGSGFTRITTELADMPGHPARVAASRHKAAVEAWLAAQLGALGAAAPEPLAREVMLLIEGSMSLALVHGDTRYIQSAAGAARRLVGTPET